MMASSSAEKTQTVREGKAEIFSPAHVFYNPVQEFNRDLTIAVISEFVCDHYKKVQGKEGKFKADAAASLENSEGITAKLNSVEIPEESGIKYTDGVRILEALSASGLRSVRFALEIPGVKEIVTNDFDEVAVGFIRRNVEHNKVSDIITPSCADASMLMYQNRKISQRFDVIDLDPYGSASPFLDSAVQAIKDGGLLCVTCTDMAVLAGNAPETCHSKYQAISLKAKFCHEQALRILLQCIDSHANRYSRYIVPLISISADFYIRVFLRVYSGQSQVKHSVTKLAMLYNCVNCGKFTVQPLAAATPTNNKGDYKFTPARAPTVEPACTICHSKHVMGGPIWSARIHDVEFVNRVIERVNANKSKFGTAERIIGMLTVVSEELHDVPLYYIHDELNRLLHCNPMKTIELRSALLHAGYEVSFSHCHKNSVKTTAPMEVLWDIHRCWVEKNPVKDARLKEGSIGKIILSQPTTIQANFTEHEDANPSSRRKGLLRWQHNPERDWGPKARATKGETGNLEHRRLKGVRKAREKKRKAPSQVIDFKQFACKRYRSGLCLLPEGECKYSHSIKTEQEEDSNQENKCQEPEDMETDEDSSSEALDSNLADS